MAEGIRQRVHHESSSVLCIKWTLTDADPTGDWVELPVGRDRSVHVIYVAGTGTVTIQGSNENVAPTSPRTLTAYDETGVLGAMTFTVTGLRQVLPMTLKIRPLLSGGTGATIAIYLVTGGD